MRRHIYQSNPGLFVPAPGGGAGFAFIDGVSAGTSGPESDVTTAAIDTTGANLIVVSVGSIWFASATLSDSKSNTWTLIQNRSADVVVSGSYYCFNPTVGSGHTFTMTANGSSSPSLAVAAFSGADTSPLETHTGSTGTSATPSASTGLTPAEDNELVVAFVAVGNGSPSRNIDSIDDGFTLDPAAIPYTFNIKSGVALAYLIQTSAALADPDWTLSGSQGWAAEIACFKAA